MLHCLESCLQKTTVRDKFLTINYYLHLLKKPLETLRVFELAVFQEVGVKIPVNLLFNLLRSHNNVADVLPYFIFSRHVDPSTGGAGDGAGAGSSRRSCTSPSAMPLRMSRIALSVALPEESKAFILTFLK